MCVAGATDRLESSRLEPGVTQQWRMCCCERHGAPGQTRCTQDPQPRKQPWDPSPNNPPSLTPTWWMSASSCENTCRYNRCITGVGACESRIVSGSKV